MRFDRTIFPNRDAAQQLSARLISQMDAGLQRLTEGPSDNAADKTLGAIELAQVGFEDGY